MAKRKAVAEEEREEPEGPAGAGPAPEEKAEIFYRLLQELKKMGVPTTPENLSLLLRNRHPEVKLVPEDVPTIIETVNKLKQEAPQETPPGAPHEAPTISSALALVKALVQKFGKDELKRIIDLFD